jgi:hypothetical protein
MSQNDLKCFANTGVNSLQTPCRAHEYVISTSHPVLLPSELRKPIEKSACLATIVRAIAYLGSLEQTTGHRRIKAMSSPSLVNVSGHNRRSRQ